MPSFCPAPCWNRWISFQPVVKLYLIPKLDSVPISVDISNFIANCESRNLQTISGGCPALPSSLSFGNNSVNFRQPADHCFRTTRLNGSTSFHPGTELHQNSFSTSQRTSRCYETLKPNCCWLWWLVWLFYLFVLLFCTQLELIVILSGLVVGSAG